MLSLSKSEARALMISAQLLDGQPRTVKEVVEGLGAVQIDTINVVRKSQYLVLWSRLGRHDESGLDRLLYPDRAVFEYWGHAASILPIADFAYYRPKMIRYRDHMWPGFLKWADANPGVLESTLARVRDQGPTSSADFETPADGRRAGRWDWIGPKATRFALEVLYSQGELMVHSRRAGQKVYDLRERLLAEAFPGGAPSDDELPGDAAMRRYFALKTLRAVGIVKPIWLHDYFRLAVPEKGSRTVEAGALLDELVGDGAAERVEIEGLKGPFYADTARLAAKPTRPCRTTLLSPFDSLIWQRDRARALFDYDVSFEAYVVPEKRKYGYYCLAILHHDRVVGRADLKMERGDGVLRARGLWLEPGVEIDDDLVSGVAGALSDLALHLGGKRAAVDRAEPKQLRAPLAKALR